MTNRLVDIVSVLSSTDRCQISRQLDIATGYFEIASLLGLETSRLFGSDRSVILRHVRNIFGSKELESESTCAKIVQVAAEGKSHQMDAFNLDVVIGVGYRVNSHHDTEFRIWATNMLRDHPPHPPLCRTVHTQHWR